MNDRLPDIWNYWVYDDDDRDPEAQHNDAEYFHGEEFDADFLKWIRRGNWTADQATALTFGKNPDRMNLDYASNGGRHPSEFAQYYVNMHERVVEAQRCGSLPNWIPPAVYVQWANENRISIPPDIEVGLTAAENEITDLRQRNSELVDQVELLEDETSELKQRLMELKYQLDKARTSSVVAQAANEVEEAPKRQSDESRDRNTLLKIILSIAIEKYRYKIDGAKQSATRHIADATLRNGLKVSDDTVQKRLDEARNLFRDEIASPKSI